MKREIVFPFFDLATSCKMASVSEVDWKIAPAFTSSSLKLKPLVKFPLWAIAKPPTAKSANNGWTFLRTVPPVVEYLTCPIAELPGNRLRTLALVKFSLTKPILLSAWKWVSS